MTIGIISILERYKYPCKFFLFLCPYGVCLEFSASDYFFMQPYVEESKKIMKEEKKEATINHNKQQSTQDTGEAKWPSLCGDYLVTSQPEADDSLVNKANVGLALKMAENAPKDPSYLMDWYSCHSLEMPAREPE